MQSADIQQAFEKHDTSGDGTVDAAELIALLRTTGQNPIKSEVEKLILEFDKDGSGSLDFEEFCEVYSFISKAPKEEDAQLLDALNALDTNGDGFFNREELMGLLTQFGDDSLTEEEADEFLKQFDIDGDGRLSFAEIVKMTSELGDDGDGAEGDPPLVDPPSGVAARKDPKLKARLQRAAKAAADEVQEQINLKESQLGRCSAAISGNDHLVQSFWLCVTCDSTSAQALCMECCLKCHRGHNLLPGCSPGKAWCACSDLMECACTNKPTAPPEVCTSAMSGLHLQLAYRCTSDTCPPSALFCATCAQTCHAGHEVNAVGETGIQCACGDGKMGECKADTTPNVCTAGEKVPVVIEINGCIPRCFYDAVEGGLKECDINQDGKWVVGVRPYELDKTKMCVRFKLPPKHKQWLQITNTGFVNLSTKSAPTGKLTHIRWEVQRTSRAPIASTQFVKFTMKACGSPATMGLHSIRFYDPDRVPIDPPSIIKESTVNIELDKAANLVKEGTDDGWMGKAASPDRPETWVEVAFDFGRRVQLAAYELTGTGGDAPCFFILSVSRSAAGPWAPASTVDGRTEATHWCKSSTGGPFGNSSGLLPVKIETFEAPPKMPQWVKADCTGPPPITYAYNATRMGVRGRNSVYLGRCNTRLGWCAVDLEIGLVYVDRDDKGEKIVRTTKDFEVLEFDEEPVWKTIDAHDSPLPEGALPCAMRYDEEHSTWTRVFATRSARPPPENDHMLGEFIPIAESWDGNSYAGKTMKILHYQYPLEILCFEGLIPAQYPQWPHMEDLNLGLDSHPTWPREEMPTTPLEKFSILPLDSPFRFLRLKFSAARVPDGRHQVIGISDIVILTPGGPVSPKGVFRHKISKYPDARLENVLITRTEKVWAENSENEIWMDLGKMCYISGMVLAVGDDERQDPLAWDLYGVDMKLVRYDYLVALEHRSPNDRTPYPAVDAFHRLSLSFSPETQALIYPIMHVNIGRDKDMPKTRFQQCRANGVHQVEEFPIQSEEFQTLGKGDGRIQSFNGTTRGSCGQFDTAPYQKAYAPKKWHVFEEGKDVPEGYTERVAQTVKSKCCACHQPPPVDFFFPDPLFIIKDQFVSFRQPPKFVKWSAEVLNPEETAQTLDRFAAIAREYLPGARFTVITYTDGLKTGERDWNLSFGVAGFRDTGLKDHDGVYHNASRFVHLAQWRSAAVKRLLEARGIADVDVEAIGAGTDGNGGRTVIKVVMPQRPDRVAGMRLRDCVCSCHDAEAPCCTCQARPTRVDDEDSPSCVRICNGTIDMQGLLAFVPGTAMPNPVWAYNIYYLARVAVFLTHYPEVTFEVRAYTTSLAANIDYLQMQEITVRSPPLRNAYGQEFEELVSFQTIARLRAKCVIDILRAMGVRTQLVVENGYAGKGEGVEFRVAHGKRHPLTLTPKNCDSCTCHQREEEEKAAYEARTKADREAWEATKALAKEEFPKKKCVVEGCDNLKPGCAFYVPLEESGPTSDFCTDHRCAECEEGVYLNQSFCAQTHQCERSKCRGRKKDGYPGCDVHTCGWKDKCKSFKLKGDTFCLDHQCAAKGCGSARSKLGRCCEEHTCDNPVKKQCIHQRMKGHALCSKCQAEKEAKEKEAKRCKYAERKCQKEKTKGSLYCGEHSCKTCSDETPAVMPYCELHRCVADTCPGPREEGGNFCCDHTCAAEACLASVEPKSTFCLSHKCDRATCPAGVEGAFIFCKKHLCAADQCGDEGGHGGGKHCANHSCAFPNACGNARLREPKNKLPTCCKEHKCSNTAKACYSVSLPDGGLCEACQNEEEAVDAIKKRLKAKNAKTGEISCSLMWNTCADLDIFLVINGEVCYYGARQVGGATLDVDANMNCDASIRTNTPVENIYLDPAVAGSYKISVNYYQKISTDPEECPYSVVLKRGDRYDVYERTFTRRKDQHDIVSFEWPPPVVEE